MAILRPGLLLLILLTLLTGGVYPTLTTLVGQWWFPGQANGSLIIKDGQVRGSTLIGQDFTEAKYFHGRPSATADSPYNSMASGGSNLAVSNPQLVQHIQERIKVLRATNPQANLAVPVELITSSGSGLDGQLSPQAVAWQAPRVAQARNLSLEQLTRLIAKNTSMPLVSFIGMPVVNIVNLNMALDALPTP